MNIWRQRQRCFSALLVCKVLLIFGVGCFLGVKPHIVSAAVITLSGTVYTDEGSTNIGSGKTVRVAVNGTDHSTIDDTDGSGAYSITDISVEVGDVITAYLEDENEDAVTVTVTDGSGNITDLDLYQNYLVTRHDGDGGLTNADLSAGAVGSEDDISNIYFVDNNGVTLASDKHLLIWAGNTYEIEGPLTIGGNLVVEAGALLSGEHSVIVEGGSATGDGAVGLTAGIFTLKGTGEFGGDTNWSFRNLTFGDGLASTTTSKIGSNNIEVVNGLVVASNHTLNAGSATWNFTGSGMGALLGEISAVSAGPSSSCALKSDGSRVYCWGSNTNGTLGDGSNVNRTFPVEVLGVGGTGYLSDISAISVGNAGQACALKSDGSRVYCWGGNSSGQLGDGSTNNSAFPVEVLGVGGSGNLSGISMIEAGGSTCALKSDGSRVYCWGAGGSGQRGDGGTTATQSSPVEVLGVGGSGNLSGISAVSAGSTHTCALKSDGSRVYCWGAAASGRLGNGATTPNQTSPVEVLGVGGSGNLSGISAVSAGREHTCALKSDGSRVYCWGAAGSGRLGNGTTTPNQTSPVEVLGVGGSGNLSNVTSVVAGSNRSCALKSDGSRVYCWGAGSSDPLENGITSPNYTSPVEILDVGGAGNLSNISMIDGSWEHICAVKIGGSGVYCWGTATGGSLGNGGTTSISGHITPVEVLAIGGSDKLFDVSMVTTGDTHTCALKSDGSRVYCWGAASSGRLGNGTSTSNQASPVAVLGIGGSGYLSGISAISAGSTHTCALKSDGSRVYCWGAAGNGRLGNGATTPNQTSPVEVLGVGGSGTLSDISAISAGTSHTCALKSDGSRVYCWGLNTNGRLGDASATQRTSPVEVKDVGGSDTLSGISAISAGGAHTCALKSDGSRVYCWGAAASGRLGNGQTSPDQTSPVEVLGVAGSGNLSGISQIAAGGGQTCALKSDGSRVYCWGLGSSGQRGDGSAGANQTSPVEVLGVGGSGTLSDISAISTGNSSAHTCALKSDGSRVYCWGAAGNGRLGNGATTPNQTSPVEVLGVGGSGTLSDISAISAGGSAYTCALKSSNSRIYCWGAGSSGQRGDGTTGTSQLSPVEVVTFSIGPFIFNGSLSAQTSTFNVTGSYGEEIMTAIHVSISLGSYHGLGLDDSNKPFVFTDDVSLTGSLTLTSGELIMTKLAGIISLAGDWSSVGGTFTPGTSTVDLIGGDQAISGSNTFYNLTKQETTNNSTHSTLSVQVSSIQTILNELDLDGLDENDMLQVRSSVNGTRHTWDVLQSDQTATFLDVQDSQTSTNDITCTNCTQGTNTDGDESSPHWAFGEGDPDVTPPTIDSLSPADNATDIATSSNLVITFDEAVTTESGNVTIYKSSDDSEVEAIDVTSGQVTGSGTTTITINPSSDLDEQTGYYVQIDATAFDDTAGNSYVGIADTTSWNFTTADETAPQVSSVTAPSNGSYTTGQNLDFTVNTTENVTVNTGGGTPRLELTIGATTRYASYTSGSGSSALVFRYTIQAGDTDTDGIILTSPLQTNGGTIRDAAANNLTTTFTSPNLSNILVDTTNPTIDSLSPADNATDIATSSNLVITFDEAVTTESGNVTIYKSSDDSEVEAIDVTSGQVTGSGTDTITINPSTDLDEQTEYYVLVEDAAFDDIPGNSFAGISDTTDWSFTTVDEEEGEEDEEEDVSSGSTPSPSSASGGADPIFQLDAAPTLGKGGIISAPFNKSVIFTAKPVDADRLVSFTLTVLGKVYTFRPVGLDPSNPIYTTTITFTTPGVIPYVLRADWGVTDRKTYGAFLVLGIQDVEEEQEANIIHFKAPVPNEPISPLFVGPEEEREGVFVPPEEELEIYEVAPIAGKEPKMTPESSKKLSVRSWIVIALGMVGGSLIIGMMLKMGSARGR